MTITKLNRANEIQNDIDYLKRFLFINESASKETRDAFVVWKENKIKQLKSEFDKL